MTRYARNPSIDVTEIAGEYFLVETDSDRIYYLDEISSGIWRLLETPCEQAEFVETYAAAFPDAPTESLTLDLAKVIDDLLDADLIRKVDEI